MNRRWLGAALATVGLSLLLYGTWIPAKAWLAQQLLESAWENSLRTGERQRPWPWADHWPVAELRLPGRRLIVLAGDQGPVLAFAPGHSPRSGLPGDTLTTVISGHRDTHFRELHQLGHGDELSLATRQGRYRYRVADRQILDARRDRLSLRDDGALLLVTCWPPQALTVGGPQRLIVRAERIDPAEAD